MFWYVLESIYKRIVISIDPCAAIETEECIIQQLGYFLIHRKLGATNVP